MISHKIASHTKGFTLIELSIVLVIIGLIIGGILVGQDLIASATVRSQVTQIEKYRTAVNTFYGKYNGLPGDLTDPQATHFGFIARGTGAGQGDGNGIIQAGWNNPAIGQPGNNGEDVAFWVDLSSANLLDGKFNTGYESGGYISSVSLTSTPNLSAYFPQAKIGQGNFIYVWNGYVGTYFRCCSAPSPTTAAVGPNWFGLAAITNVTCCGTNAGVGLTVAQAYAMDAKTDDGLPLTGQVIAASAMYAQGGNGFVWASGGQPVYYPAPGNGTDITSGSATSCFDLRGLYSPPWLTLPSGVIPQYSTEISSGGNVNCALSFQFQ